MIMEKEKFNELLINIREGKSNIVDLSSEKLKKEQLSQLATALAGNSSVKTLKMGSSYLNDEGLDVIAPALKNTSIESISLDNSSFTSKNMPILARNLPTSCKRLVLSGSKIGNVGIAYLLKNMDCPNLQELWLNGIGMSDEGIKALANFIDKNSVKLEELNISGNVFSTDGINYFAEKLRKCGSLRSLFAEDICREESEIQSLLKVLHISIERLHIGADRIGEKPGDFAALLQLVQLQKHLTELDVAHNGIGLKDMQQLVTAVSLRESAVCVFDVAGNKMKFSDMRKLDMLLRERKSKTDGSASVPEEERDFFVSATSP